MSLFGTCTLDDGCMAIVTELVPGRDLGTVVRERSLNLIERVHFV